MSKPSGNFQPFVMERMMSKWENVVEYNLSESGVHPLAVRELVDDPAVLEEVLATPLHYPQTNGIVELRENIAALYPGAAPHNVLVTVGCIEANFIALQALVAPGEEIVVMLPNYMQIWGAAQNLGIRVRTFHLREELGWAPDLDELSDVVSEKTKLIAVCNPDNPTGHILTEAEMGAIVALAERAGAWLLADEVYSGAERLTDTQTPSFWGQYDKVLAMNSLSKAYGLPGLRIGWVVSHEGTFSLVPPEAAAIAYVRYHLDLNSTELVERLMREKGVFIVPGDHFGMDHYLRISFGVPEEYLRKGLDRIHELIVKLQG
jgi:aspartate/methionine/tyrosine aminotransferase